MSARRPAQVAPTIAWGPKPDRSRLQHCCSQDQRRHRPPTEPVPRLLRPQRRPSRPIGERREHHAAVCLQALVPVARPVVPPQAVPVSDQSRKRPQTPVPRALMPPARLAPFAPRVPGRSRLLTTSSATIRGTAITPCCLLAHAKPKQHARPSRPPRQRSPGCRDDEERQPAIGERRRRKQDRKRRQRHQGRGDPGRPLTPCCRRHDAPRKPERCPDRQDAGDHPRHAQARARTCRTAGCSARASTSTSGGLSTQGISRKGSDPSAMARAHVP